MRGLPRRHARRRRRRARARTARELPPATTSSSSGRSRAPRCSACSVRPTPRPHLCVGELPARGGRGARSRDAGDRDAHRRRRRDRPRRRERPARRARRRRARSRPRCGATSTTTRSVSGYGRRRRRPSPTTTRDAVYGATRDDPSGGGRMRRVLFVARNRYRVPLSASLQLKWDALAEVLRACASSRRRPTRSRGDDTFRLRARTPLRRAAVLALAAAAACAVRCARSEPTSSSRRARSRPLRALLARTGVPVIVELHGDWRTFGAPLRLAARGGCSRARRTRSAPGRCAELRRSAPSRRYTARACPGGRSASPPPSSPRSWTSTPFAAPTVPLPQSPIALFVGVLEPYKNIDGLAEAWRRARPARRELRIVGKGTRTDVVASLVRDGLATWQPELSTEEIVARARRGERPRPPVALRGDGARRDRGAAARPPGRSASNVGGIPDLVHRRRRRPARSSRRPTAIAAALVARARRPRASWSGSRRTRAPRASAWLVTPEEYAARMRELVER